MSLISVHVSTINYYVTTNYLQNLTRRYKDGLFIPLFKETLVLCWKETKTVECYCPL